MIDKIKNFFSPPVFEDQEKTQAAALLNGFLLITIAGTLLFIIGKLPEIIQSGLSTADISMFGFVPVNIALFFVMKKGHVRVAGFIFATQMWLLLTLQAWLFNGGSDSGLAAYILVIIASALLLGWRAAFLFTGLSIAAAWVFAYFETRGLIVVEYLPPSAYAVTWTLLFLTVIGMEYLIINALTKARHLVEERSQQLTELTTELDGQARRQAADLLNIAEIGSNIARIRDVEKVMQHAVDMIRERYGLYHAQIYLLDDTSSYGGDRLILSAATGEIGEQLLVRAHQLPLSMTSSNGIAVLERRVVLDGETAVSSTYRSHPLLPDTKSEVVIPLLVGDRVLGTLDLHHTEIDGFDEETATVFETISSQLAVAIDNANLLTEWQQTSAALRSSEALFGNVINNATAVIYVKQADGKYMLVNKLYEELFGINSEEIKGKTDHDIFSAENAEALRQRDIDVLAQQGTVISEEEIPHADGLRTYISTKFPLFNEQGEVYAVAGILTDITKIKAAEVALADRISELDLFNGIGRRIEENTPVPAFLEWAATQIPTAMSHAEGCTASIQWDGELYGDIDAGQKPRHIIEEMQVQSRHIGYITVAYDNLEHDFEDADSALAGGVGQRIAAYLQTQLLLTQAQVRSADLQTVTEIGTAVSAISDPHILLKSAVDLTKEKFGLYHAAIFLVDELNQELISSAGSGDGGDEELNVAPVVLQISDFHSVTAQAARQRRWTVLSDVKTELNVISQLRPSDVASELAIPMQIGDALLGVLNVQSVEVNAFSEEKAAIYTALATQITVALQNARQYEQTQVALDEVNTLQQSVASEGRRRFARKEGYLATTDGVQPLTENDRLQINDSEHIIMPMSVRGAKIGNIAVRADTAALSGADKELLNAISAQVAEALERARFFEEIEQARHHTETLYNIGRVLPTIETSSELLRTIADGAAESINADQLLLLLCDVEKERVDYAVAGGVGREKVGLDINFSDIWNGLSGWTLREGKTAFSPKFVRDERESTLAHEYRLSHDVGSLIVVPLIYQDNILGTMTAINPLNQPDFTQAEVDLLTAFSIQATVAIENRNLLDATQKRAGREQTLREITNRVNKAVDAESVLKTAVKEVGRAMGLEIFAYLDDTISMDSNTDAKDVG